MCKFSLLHCYNTINPNLTSDKYEVLLAKYDTLGMSIHAPNLENYLVTSLRSNNRPRILIRPKHGRLEYRRLSQSPAPHTPKPTLGVILHTYLKRDDPSENMYIVEGIHDFNRYSSTASKMLYYTIITDDVNMWSTWRRS